MTIDEAIELLENCEYLTNREEKQLAEWLEELKMYKEVGTVEDYKSAIECYNEEYTSTEHINCSTNTSTDTSNNGWIPCSERLPDDLIDVLVWFEYYRFGNYNRLYQTIGISYTNNGEWSRLVNGTSGWKELRIIAWKPLPQPYKESE